MYIPWNRDQKTLWPVGEILPTADLGMAYNLRMVFTFLNSCLKKNQKPE